MEVGSGVREGCLEWSAVNSCKIEYSFHAAAKTRVRPLGSVVRCYTGKLCNVKPF